MVDDELPAIVEQVEQRRLAVRPSKTYSLPIRTLVSRRRSALSRSRGRIDGDVEHLKLLDDPYLLVTRQSDLPDGPVRLKNLDGAPMVAWPATCDQPRMEQALARRCAAADRVPQRGQRNHPVHGAGRNGNRDLAMARPPGSDAWTDTRLGIHQLRPLPARESYLHWPAGRTQSSLAARTIDIAIDVANDLAKRIRLRHGQMLAQ